MNKLTTNGAYFAVTAYFIWGVLPVYFKQLQSIPATEILSHRIIWSFLLTIIIILLLNKREALMIALRSKATRWALLLSTTLIGFNWGLYIWSVNSNHILDASLGYYINPLINILLGMLFFRERLDRVRAVATALCIFAVILEVVQFGRLPWIALLLASSFAIYGLVRKKLGVDSFSGMVMETGLMLPLAIGYLLWTTTPSSNLLDNDLWTNSLLLAAGPVTMIPLICFATAANRISLSSLGFFQYISPSCMFLLAVLVYDEPIQPEKMATFGLIWLALLILSVDSVRKYRQSRIC